MTARADLAIVGAGPGGYVAALRAAQLGLNVTLVEERALGGVCLNRGCIPTKAMLQTASLVHECRAAVASGLLTGSDIGVDYTAALQRRDLAVSRLTKGVAGLLRHAGVRVVAGHASFTGPNALAVTASGPGQAGDVAQEIDAGHIVVATGSRPAALPVPGGDHPQVIDSDGALALTEVPARLLVVGGGAVGCEWTTIFSRLGSQVTLVEMLPSLLPREEPELAAVLVRALRQEVVTVHTSTSVLAVDATGGALQVTLSPEGTVKVDAVLVAAGRQPLTTGLDLDRAGVTTDSRGWILVDDYGRTNVPSILAIGDVTGQALLAHVASRQGIVAVEKLAGLSPAPVRKDRIPSVTFTDPEVASAGLTEAEAREQGVDVRVGRFPFSASGRAVATGHETGLVKVVADARFDRVLGVHMVGAHVGELLAEAVLALELESTLDELTMVIRAHPTLSEAVGEAALAATGNALHTVNQAAEK
ncbi:MAG: dihydrolipoyl dehydrogenase [Thermoleophilia bacterium]|nr:dihydrolipoyl dehydrogenase [Thermoleophilia bacterium]